MSDSSMGLVMGKPVPPTPPFIVLINNLNLEGKEWLEALKNMSLSTRPSQIVTRPMDTSVIGFSLVDPPSSKRICNVDDDSSSLSKNSSPHYFLGSQKKIVSSRGLGKEVIRTLDRGGRGRKYLISKEQSKAKSDLLGGKQQTIERALRAM